MDTGQALNGKAEAVIKMRNCSVAGNIVRYPALSCQPFQALYLFNFVEESLRPFSGRHAIAPKCALILSIQPHETGWGLLEPDRGIPSWHVHCHGRDAPAGDSVGRRLEAISENRAMPISESADSRRWFLDSTGIGGQDGIATLAPLPGR